MYWWLPQWGIRRGDEMVKVVKGRNKQSRMNMYKQSVFLSVNLNYYYYYDFTIDINTVSSYIGEDTLVMTTLLAIIHRSKETKPCSFSKAEKARHNFGAK